jgi:hypothetical protein
MFARAGIAALISLVFLVGPGMAQTSRETPVVVELFTSQGCSSCPPADAFLGLLAPRDDVIALGLHVDYWDYIGWKDVFGSPVNSSRQKAYAKAAGRRSVYTPQMIVQGEADVVGNHPMDVTDLIAEYRERPQRVSLAIRRGEGAVLHIEARAVASVTRPMIVQVVRYQPETQVEITRGENAGHKLAYSNVVTDWTVVGEWTPPAPFDAEVPIEGDRPVVVLIQQRGPGPIEAAARLR